MLLCAETQALPRAPCVTRAVSSAGLQARTSSSAPWLLRSSVPVVLVGDESEGPVSQPQLPVCLGSGCPLGAQRELGTMPLLELGG